MRDSGELVKGNSKNKLSGFIIKKFKWEWKFE